MDAAPIQYAPVKRGDKRRLIVRRLFQLTILAILVPVLLKCGLMGWSRAQVLYWQRKAMVYSLPPSQVVLDVSRASGSSWETGHNMTAPALDHLCGGRADFATLFLHELRNGKGESRLVAVESPGWIPRIEIFATVASPAGLFNPSKQSLETQSYPIDLADASHIHFYAGQPDSSDSSHFTIRYDADGKLFQIDGYLNDHDRIDFSTREIK